MSDRDSFKAETDVIKGSAKGGAGNQAAPPGTKLQPSLDHASFSQTKASPSVDVQSENTLHRVTAGTDSMEIAVDKHRGISQRRCHDTSGLSETHKIKLSYKSLAAIPTNTLLLDQQVIDEEVEREESPCDSLHRGVDTHAEMCSPAELRQQSEELYAVIDEILADSIPTSKSSRSQEPSRSSTPNTGLQNNSSFTKSLGRETKYASVCSLHPSTCVERKLVNPKKTKPGVIRPMTAIPRLTVDEEEEFHPNPFRQSERVWQTSADNKKVDRRQKDFYASPESQSLREERKPERRGPSSVCDLQITEPDERVSAPVKDASASFSPTEGRMEASETHI